MTKPFRRRHNRERLIFARRWLRLTGKRHEVFIAAADALGVKHPTTRANGYALLDRFYDTFRHSVTPRRSAPPQLPKPVRPAAQSQTEYVNSDAFLQSYEWRRLRMEVLTERGARCECCGAAPRDGIVIHVDHIKPRRKYPALALTKSNLQILCEVCNHGKGSWNETDWRADSQLSGESSADSPVPRSGDGDGHLLPIATFARVPGQTRANIPRLVDKAKRSG